MQVPCRGRGEAPSPETVNSFIYHIKSFLNFWHSNGENKYIIVHCTHGFNRTGTMPWASPRVVLSTDLAGE